MRKENFYTDEDGRLCAAGDYVYSSAADYAESKVLLDNVIVFKYFG